MHTSEIFSIFLRVTAGFLFGGMAAMNVVFFADYPRSKWRPAAIPALLLCSAASLLMFGWAVGL